MSKTSRKTTKASDSTHDPTTQYAEDVVSGRITAGPHVRNACRRHLDDLKHGPARGLHWDLGAARRFCEEFCGGVLRLSEGQFEGKPFIMHPSQWFIAGSIYGWKWKASGKRRFRRAFIEQGKGNGKSPLAGAIGLYGMAADGEAGAEIYSAGATKSQAGILFRDAVKMADQSPQLQAPKIQRSGGPGREYNLAYLKNSSFFRPVSRETKKTGSGPRPHYALCDEVHEHPDRGIIDMLERGFKFRQQPLLFMITNSGFDRDSICWEEHCFAIQVAAGDVEAKDGDCEYKGDIIDDSAFSYVCALDPEDDPLTDRSCWEKANPLLGVTITEDWLAGEVSKGMAMPGKLNGIRRLHFCQWTDSEEAWITRKALSPCLGDFDPEKYHGRRAWVGMDLSQNKDFTALAVLLENGSSEDGRPKYKAFVNVWTPGDTLAERDKAEGMNDKYLLWRDQGWLLAPKGSSIDYLHVAQGLTEVCRDYDVQWVAYDRYAHRKFEEQWADVGSADVQFVEHPQAGVRKGKPPESARKGADGLWMPSSFRDFEEMISKQEITMQNNPVLISAITSSALDTDRWDNRWMSKRLSGKKKKIDAAVALCMAVGAAGLSDAEASVYQARGLRELAV